MLIGIIGGGKVGCCLAEYLHKAGLLCGITASTADHNKNLAERFGLPIVSNLELVAKADVLLLTVPDRLVEQVAASLTSEKLSGKTFLHVSGSLGLEPLEQLAKVQAHIGSLHPLQSFAANVHTELQGVYMAIDGDEQAKQVAIKLAKELGGTPFFVPAAERAAYHAAACICSNYAVTVEALAQQLMARWTGSEEAAWEALKPLFKGTANNLLIAKNAKTVLTGPIGRGDTNTIQKHLSVLPPELLATYCNLGQETVKVALYNKTINNKAAEQLLRIMQQQLEDK